MSTLLWILFGILIYTSAAMALSARGLLPPSFKVAGPILTIHTRRGRAFLDWLSSPGRFWRAWGNLGIGIALVIMVGTFLAVLFSAYSAVTEPSAARIARPQDALVIPGVNQFLPWAAAIHILVGLLVGLVVHEGGHGLLCRVEDIEIESMGVALLAFVPLGAFVQPDEESQEAADRGSKTRMFAAGVTNNFLVTAVTFALLFAVIAGFVTVASGVAIGGALPGSPAEDAGIERGDVITSVDGQAVDDEAALEAALAEADREVTVERKDDEPVTVKRNVFVSRTVVDAPVAVGTGVQAVDGEAVYTRSEFEAALEDEEVVELETEDGIVRFPVGVFVSGAPGDEPLGEAGAADSPMLIHSVDGEVTPTPEALASVMGETEAGDSVEVVVYQDGGTDPWSGQRRTFEVTVGEHPTADHGFLGAHGVRAGTSGVVVDDFGIDSYPAEQYHALLGGSGWGDDAVTTFVSRTFVLLVLPFASIIDPSLGYNFAGFNGAITNFYDVSGPLSAGVVFALANVLFWTGWVNINLGIFNCIPSYPLDGGHILRSCVEATLARLPVEATPTMASVVTTAISISMILSLLGLLFVPQLLG